MSTNRIIQADQIEGLVFQGNAIKNAIAEKNVNLWTGYDDGASSRPVDGSGGTPTGVTLSLETSSPLDGSASFKISKDAADRQGKGYAYDFSIPNAWKFRTGRVKFSYRVAGTYDGGTPSTDSDLICYLYRVTATAHLMEPVPFKLDGAVVGQNYEALIDFQFEDGADYRLIFHIATASASAWDFVFDNISVSTSQESIGSVVTPWQDYTPTGAWVTNSTYAGKWRRVGDSMEIAAKVDLSGAPNATGLTFTIPAGYAIDTAKILSASFLNVGTCEILANNKHYSGIVTYFDTTTVSPGAIVGGSGNGHELQGVTDVFPDTFGASEGVNVLFKVPIVGFGATATIGTDADTRVVSLLLKKSNAQTIPDNAYTQIEYNVTTKDSHGIWNGGTYQAAIPVSGVYLFSAVTEVDGSATGGRQNAIYVNGVHAGTMGHEPGTAATTDIIEGSIMLDLKAGDLVDLRFIQNSGGNLDVGTFGIGANHFEMVRMSGPSQIHAGEKIIASYSSATPQSMANNTFTRFDYDTRVIDTHNAVTIGASWVFKAPRKDVFRVSGHNLFDSNATGFRMMDITKNGVQFRVVQVVQSVSSVGAGSGVGGTTLVPMNQGDEIYISLFQNSGGSINAGVSAHEYNHISIESV